MQDGVSPTGTRGDPGACDTGWAPALERGGRLA
jgi:hypothetical protein